MKGKRLNSALIGLLVLGLVVPTGAALPTLTDSVFESNELVLRPYDGPNGRTYVSSVEDTRDDAEGARNLSIDLSKINLEAKTEVDNVFVMANEGDEPLTVWVTHDATAYLTIERSDTGAPIQGQSNRVDLEPGEEIPIGFSIDTQGGDLSEGDLLLQTITVHAADLGGNSPPVADLVAPSQAGPGQSIVLDASDSRDPDNDTLTYTWDLDDDGNFDDASGPIVRRSFSSLPATVRVNVSDGRGGFDTAQATIGANQPPNAEFDVPSTALVNQTVPLSAAGSSDPEAGSLSYAWDLDNDGAFDDATGQTVQHAFDEGGPNPVRLQVTDQAGQTDTAAATVAVNGPPSAALTASPRQVAPGTTVQLDASGSSDAEGDSLTYDWDLDNDGTTDRQTSTPTIEVTVNEPPRTVSVAVTDETGQTDTARLTIGSAENNLPDAVLSAPTETTVGESVTLNAGDSSDPDGDPLTFAWDLNGDGTFETTSNVSSLTRVFQTPGDRRVAVQVTDGRGGLDTASTTVTVNPIENDTQPANETVEIGDENETDGNENSVSVRELNTDELPTGGENEPPEAVVRNVDAASNGTISDGGLNRSELQAVFGQQEQSEAVERSLRAAGAEAVTDVGRPITLSGTSSIVRSTRAVDGEGRIVQAWDITPRDTPTEEPVTLRLQVQRSRFPEGSDPADARVGHFTGDGWQVLDTRIIRTTESVVVYEVQATSFSPFAVFADNEVQHSWTLSNGTVIEGRTNIRAVFDEIGLHNVTLTVTDAFGQTDSTDYRILVNDPPQPTIDVSGEQEPGEPITLRANVTNEVGEITDVVWRFDDGTRVFNDTVTVKFGQGQHPIRLVVRDVYGSVGTSRTQLQIGGTLPQEGQSEPTDPGVPNAGAIVLVGLGAAFTFLSGRWAYPGNLAMLRPVSPRVSVLQNPTWDDGVIRIQDLRVEDPNGDLERVVITVLDPNENALLEKEIELDPTHSYEAGPERIQAPMLRGEDLTAGYEVMVQGFDEKDHSSRREHQPIDR